MSQKDKTKPGSVMQNTEKRIAATLTEAKANQALEGCIISAEAEKIARAMLSGALTPSEARQHILAHHGLRVAAS